MAPTHRLFIRHASQLVVVCRERQPCLTKAKMDKIAVIEDGSLVVDEAGKIEAVWEGRELDERYESFDFEKVIDARGKSVVPGFVDGHTHPVWSGDRVHEFAMKLAGATYLDIHKKLESNNADRLLRERLDRMLRQGTTLVEAKSGYGLETETEMKMLKVLHSLKEQEHPVDIVCTFLGAHSVPSGSTAEEATKDVIENQLPELLRLQARKEVSVDFVDVFHEKGVFHTDETRRILEAATKAGLKINFHGDELNPMGSGELAADLGAVAVSHLEEVSDDGISRMAEKGVFGVLLPTTAYILHLVPPPARKMIEAGVPVALGSDFNPNAHCLSMPFVMNLACVLMRMTMNEALAAATINAAGSLCKSDTHGSLEVGKWGDLVIIDSPRWEHIIYELADPPIVSVVKRGREVVADGKLV